jgi:hypothetical protein
MSKASKKVRRVEREITVEEVVLPASPEPVTGVAGRVLCGWMSQNQLATFVRAYAADDVEALRLTSRGEACRDAVTALSRRIDQSGLIQEFPSAVTFHVRQFNESPIGQRAAAEGFTVRYIDLTKLAAFQAYVRRASVRNYTLLVNRGDVAAAARIALPVDFRSELRARFDPHSGAWNIFSLDQNLRVVGQIGQPNPDGTVAIGFNFAIQPSIVKVQVYKGRSYLSDGYHRTVALLRRGFTESLALYREVSEFEQLGAVGHLPIDAFIGDRPPLLTDYWDENLSMELKVPKGVRHFLLKPQQLS